MVHFRSADLYFCFCKGRCLADTVITLHILLLLLKWHSFYKERLVTPLLARPKQMQLNSRRKRRRVSVRRGEVCQMPLGSMVDSNIDKFSYLGDDGCCVKYVILFFLFWKTPMVMNNLDTNSDVQGSSLKRWTANIFRFRSSTDKLVSCYAYIILPVAILFPLLFDSLRPSLAFGLPFVWRTWPFDEAYVDVRIVIGLFFFRRLDRMGF